MTEEKTKKELEKGEMMYSVATLDENVRRMTTLDLSNKENQVKLYNADMSCDVKLFDIKGQELTIIDVFVEEKNVLERDKDGNPIINEVTGEVKTKKNYRIVLFGDDGKTYVSTAYGIYNSISRICGIFGNPSKENPIRVEVGTRKVKNGVGESLILIIKNNE